MSSMRSWPSLGGDKEALMKQVTSGGEIVKMGYLKKLKTMKKKFFVLRADSIDASARLEYYDSEKKFKSNQPPKRSITLKTCFNINKCSDTRHKWVIALYTKNGCFCLVMDSEEDLEDWLKKLLTLQHGEDDPDGEQPKPTFEHVWQVTVQKKELGHSRNILGPHLLCLTDRTLSLVRMDPDSGKSDTIEFSLQSIRRCGDLDSFFYMEVGQMSVTGAGNLWMQTEDNNIAQNMHAAIMTACRNCKDLGPMARTRSHSTNESSRLMGVGRSSHDSHSRWPAHSAANNSNGNNINNYNNNNNIAVGGCGSGTSGGNAGGGVVGMHQRTYSFPLSPIPPSRRASTGTRPNKKPSTSHSLSGRERSDSLPSRARTTSEGASHIPQHHHRNLHLQPNLTRPQSMYTRTMSDSPPVVDSSPVSPESRAWSTDSAGSSLSMEGDGMGDNTWESGMDRYGHSLTPDEPVILEENGDDFENVHWHPSDDYVPPDRTACLSVYNPLSHKNSPNPSSSGFKSSSPSQGSLADMYSPCGSSPLESSGAYMPMSPGDKPTVTGYNYASGLRAGALGGGNSVNHSRGSSLAEEGYVQMAPMLHDDGYVDMGPGEGRHRRNLPAEYYKAFPIQQNLLVVPHEYAYQAQTYHPLESVTENHFYHYRSGELSPASSGSITSGTPSTDIRFSEYPLEKVSTYITTNEEEIVPNERPARAYSVGSRPTINKRNDIINQSECQQRVRAFSVGSRCPRTHTAHLTPPPRHPLSSSHSSVEPSEDLMELDFTRNNKSRNRVYSKKPSSSERLSVPPSSVASSAASSYSTAEGSYMEMSPRSSPKPPASDTEMDTSQFCPSPPKSRLCNFIGRSPPKSYLDMKPNLSSSSSPPVSGLSSIPLYKVPETDSSYVEMTAGAKGGLVHGSSLPGLARSSRDNMSNSLTEESYVEMSPAAETKPVIAKSSPRVDSFPVTEKFKQQNFPKNTCTPPIKQALISTSDILKSKSGQEDYLDMNNVKRKYSLIEDNNNKVPIGRTNPIDTPKKTPDGYVEMTLGNSKPVRKSSLDNYKAGETDYMNMSGGSKKERRGSRKDRNRYSSQPIAIQSTVSKDQASSTSPVFTFVGRKHSTGTPPKVPSFLPLGNYSTSPSSSPFSSLGRRTRRPPSRRESKELSSSGSSTPIFPLSLNSPSSPMKPFGQNNSKEKDSYESAAKCPVDATSGTVRISYSPAEEPAISQRQPESYDEQNEYVNYNPSIPDVQESSTNEDYAPMKPVNPLEPSRKISAPSILNNAKPRSIDRIITGMSNLTVSSPEISSVPNFNNSTSCNVSCTVTGAKDVCPDKTVNNVPLTCISVTDSNSDKVMSRGSSAATINSSIVPSISPPTCKANSSSESAVPAASATIATSSTSTANTNVITSSTEPNETLTVSTNTASSTTVTSDKELHYASLDLARSNSNEDTDNSSNAGRSLRNQSSTSSASTPSPNINQNSTPAFLYAEIDFSKSNASSSNTTMH